MMELSKEERLMALAQTEEKQAELYNDNSTTIEDPTVRKRWHTWIDASSLIDPIVEIHGLTTHNIEGLFNRTSSLTSVEQHINHIMRVADWLLKKEGE